MAVRPLVLALVSLLVAPIAAAQNFAALSAQASSPGGLSFERARAGLPGLQRPTFDTADRNGDGVIDAREFPTLQGVYNALNRRR